MKALKLLVVLVVVLVLVVVGGIAAFISFADPNDFKERIAAEIFEETGRALTLDGDLEWAFWPKLKLKAGPLALSNAPGFGDAPFVAAEEIQVAIATLPLLKRQVEMDTVKLYGLRLNLAANAEGVTNWADLVGAPGDEKEAGDMAAIALGGVDIRDAEISWRDAATGQDVDIRKLTVSTGALTFGDPIAFDLSFAAQANKPALDSDVALVGTVAYDLGEERYQIAPLTLDIVMRGKHLPGGEATVKSSAAVDIDLEAGTATIGELSVSGLGSSLNGTVTATDLESKNPGARGTLQLSGEDLAAVFAAFELPVAKQIAQLNKRGFNITTEFDANMASGKVNVPTLNGDILGATLDATLEAERANTEKPAAKGRLNAAGPDLPALLAVFGQFQGMEAKTLDNLVTVLRGTKDKSFSVQSNFDADMQTGVINVPQLEAKLLGSDPSPDDMHV
ncbi:MAG: AsmA family protein [Gammaproteobacteria bacterium]